MAWGAQGLTRVLTCGSRDFRALAGQQPSKPLLCSLCPCSMEDASQSPRSGGSRGSGGSGWSPSGLSGLLATGLQQDEEFKESLAAVESKHEADIKRLDGDIAAIKAQNAEQIQGALDALWERVSHVMVLRFSSSEVAALRVELATLAATLQVY